MLPADAPRANCADRLDLVDGSYRRKAGPEAVELWTHYCPRCPIAEACLLEGMKRHESGTWGGTSPHWRTMRGGPKAAQTKTRAA